MLAQFLEGLFAGLLLYICSADLPTLLPHKNNFSSYKDEIIFTFIFELVIYCVKSKYIALTKDGLTSFNDLELYCDLWWFNKRRMLCNPAVGFALNRRASLTHSDAEYLEYLFFKFYLLWLEAF